MNNDHKETISIRFISTAFMVLAIAIFKPFGLEVKHWHGAQKDSWFQHLTYHKDVHADASNEWLEPVDDATYNALK